MIYGLINKKNSKLRYIGKTSLSLSQRKSLHKYRARTNRDKTPKGKWLREIGTDNFDLIALDEQGDEKWWISYAKFLGCNLLNVTKGGNGNKEGGGIEITEEMKKDMGDISDKKVGRKYGVSATTITKYRNRLGIAPANEPTGAGGYKIPDECVDLLGKVSDEELAKRFAVSKRVVTFHRQKRRIKKT